MGVSRLQQPLLDSPPLARYGLPEFVKGANPAAGAAFTQAVDGRYFVRVLSIAVRLVTSATVANRNVFVEYLDDAGVRVALAGQVSTQAASLTVDQFFDCYRSASVAALDSSNLAQIPPLLLPPTYSFRIGALNLQAGDQFSRVRFCWERFFTTDQPPPSGLAGG